jgi:hypothetical protein
MPDAPATYTYVIGQLSWLLDYGEQIADCNVVTTAKDMCEEVRELDAAHKAVCDDLASETRWAAQYKQERDALAEELANARGWSTKLACAGDIMRAERDQALYVRNEVADLLDYDEDSDEALLMILKGQLADRWEVDKLHESRDAVASWQSAFEDNNAALAAICDLLGIDYLQAMELDQTNPPAAIVEAVRELLMGRQWEAEWRLKALERAGFGGNGLALWQAARERMAPPLHEQIAAIGDAIPAADLDALPPFNHNAKEATT